MEYKQPILLIDDEYADISDLEQVLRYAAIKAGHPEGITVHCESCEDAITFMKDQKKARRKISAIICDNHIGTSEIDGDNFLRIIRGNLLYCYSGFPDDSYTTAERFKDLNDLESYSGKKNSQLTRFFQDNFKDFKQYVDFYKYFYPENELSTPTIMLCGYPREANLEGLGDIYVFAKNIKERASKTACELDVLDTFREWGLFDLDEINYGIEKNGRLCHEDHKKREYNSCANRIRKMIREKRTRKK
jgi:CheY-like chemotaxis protein